MLKYLLICIYLYQALATTNNQYLVCKSVSNIFSEVSSSRNNQSSRGAPGPRGKRGPRGIQVRR